MRSLRAVETAWLEEVRTAVAPVGPATRVALVPHGDQFELVVATINSPPHWTTVKSLTDALFWFVGREDSPVARDEGDGVRGATFHLDPPLGPGSEQLFHTLEWDAAIVLKGAPA